MFACISGAGMGLRLPAAVATELQFSRGNVASFQPAGITSTREWIQINRDDAADYAQDLDLFKDSIAFVKAGRGRSRRRQARSAAARMSDRRSRRKPWRRVLPDVPGAWRAPACWRWWC